MYNKNKLGLFTLCTFLALPFSLNLSAESDKKASSSSIQTETAFLDKGQVVSEEMKQQIVNKLMRAGFREKIHQILWQPQIKLYEIVDQSLHTYLLSENQQYFFASDLYRFTEQGRLTNLSEQRRNHQYTESLDKLDPSSLIIFKPKETNAVAYVFFDIDCGYCRKLYKQMDQYLSYGIEMRYLMFPRSGSHTASYKKAVNVWCSKDKKEALALAVADETLNDLSCDHPVDKHISLGKQLGVSGTPSLLVQGKLIPGYVSAKELAQHIGLVK